MIFSVIIILIVAGVAYFHYIQGFFSATLSAFISIVAAVFAVSYHEQVITSLLGGKFADSAHAMTLCILFAVIYIVLRTIFDTLIPGNLRMPVLAEKVGAAVMGIIAGLFAGGIVAIAAQTLPFGPVFGMFSRFDVNDSHDVRISGSAGQSMQDSIVADDLKAFDIDKNRSEGRHSLYVPADEIVLGTVQRLSNDGSLAGARTLLDVHPDYLEEMALSNYGIQVGAKKTALNLAKKEQVSVPNLFSIDKPLAQIDGEFVGIRHRDLKRELVAKPTDMLLVVRVMFDHQASDSDSNVRFSPGSCPLIADRQVYYPLGTMQSDKLMVANALDDFLLVEGDKGADLVYMVPKKEVVDAKANETLPGVFVEIKRLAKVDIGGMKVSHNYKKGKEIAVYRKPDVIKLGKEAAGVQAEVVQAGPLAFKDAKVSSQLPYAVATGAPEKTINNIQTTSASGALVDGKFTKLDENGSESTTRMGAGSYTSDQLAAPAGQKLVMVHFEPTDGDQWTWSGQGGRYTLIDDKGNHHKALGCIAKVKAPDGGDRMSAKYDNSYGATDANKVDGRPTDVYLVFGVPSGSHLINVNYDAQSVGQLDLTVP